MCCVRAVCCPRDCRGTRPHTQLRRFASSKKLTPRTRHQRARGKAAVDLGFRAASQSLHFVGVELDVERVVRYEAGAEIKRQFVVDVAAGGHGSDLNWARPARIDSPWTCAAEYSDSRPVPESSVLGFGWRRSKTTFCANPPSSSRWMPPGGPVCVMSSRVCSGDGIVIEMRERDPARAAMVGPVTTNAGDSTALGQRVTRTNPPGVCADFRGQRFLRRMKPRRNSSGRLSAGAGEDLMSSI